jgi:hypothetical protein
MRPISAFAEDRKIEAGMRIYRISRWYCRLI